ncbi:mitochondrial tryptophan--tRNA ligase [Podospora conica]|nr:mitochondrial tryptophan--tRNA ligase [Schizothecium conicum]
MSRPPLLRPLRSLLQGRLSIAAARPCQRHPGSSEPGPMEQEAKELEAEDRAKAAEQGVGVSRMPRSLEALYLRPLKRTPKYGLPVCNLQLRSYSVQPLEFFCDFALRAAYYLGLPASGPVPLPRKTERWTVPKSHFIFKKSQENFSRITLSRLIQIKDGHPETVQIWLAFLQKHAYYGVGMKANVWEFSTVDVAKTMDANVAKVEEAMADKWPLLGVRNTIKPSKLKELVEKDGLHNWPLMGAQGKNDPKKIEDFIAKERLNASGGRAMSTPQRRRLFSSTSTLTSVSTQASTPDTKASQPPRPKIIFSGIQPTGIPHVGNYLGALKQWKRMQDTAEPDTKLIFSIVDLHALTTSRPHGQLTQWKREMLAAILAIGIDPARSTIFHQSTVPQHAELQWILSCTASMGYLQRMTSWKAKLAQLNPSSTDDPAPKLGLLSYPVLQAADILLHRATHVPVGDDQKQHLEFACECVTNFHAAYLPTKASPRILVRPETILSPAPRVRSLTDPAVKMSKSDPSPRSRLLLTDDRATVRKKVMAAVTDARNEVTWEPEGRPGVANLLRLWGYFDAQGRGPEELAGELRGMGLGALKGAVAEAVSEEMEPIRERFEEIMGRGGGYLEGVVEEGRVKATESAEATMREVRRVVELGA